MFKNNVSYVSKYVLIFHEIRYVFSFSFMPPQFTLFNNRDSKINPTVFEGFVNTNLEFVTDF